MSEPNPSPSSGEDRAGQDRAGDDSAREDAVKRRFREALERKQSHARSGSSHESGGGKNQHAHGPAANKRTFRRKSG